MANQSTHSAFLQLLAEATDRSALSGPDSAAAQAEEAALFPDASFSPFVPCAMVRACLRACVGMRFHAHRSTESILPFCVPTKKTKGLRRAVLLPHLPRRALGPGPPPPVRGARPRARGREPPLGPVQDPRRYVARRSSLHPAPAPAWSRSDLSSAWPPFPFPTPQSAPTRSSSWWRTWWRWCSRGRRPTAGTCRRRWRSVYTLSNCVSLAMFRREGVLGLLMCLFNQPTTPFPRRDAWRQPFRDFVQLPWWEVATNPDPGSDPVAFQAMLKGTPERGIRPPPPPTTTINRSSLFHVSIRAPPPLRPGPRGERPPHASPPAAPAPRVGHHARLPRRRHRHV